MKQLPTIAQANAIAAHASRVSLHIPGHGHISFPCRHTDKEGRNLKFWVAFHPLGNPVCGQVYLAKAGGWTPPRGLRFIREFSSITAALSAAIPYQKQAFALR